MKKKHSSRSEDNLTPWQKEHEHYLEQKRERERIINPEKQANDLMDEEQVAPENVTENPESSDELEEPMEELERVSERVSFMEKLPRLHSYHHKKMMRRILFIFFVLLIPLLISGYYVSPLSKLQNVTVTGNTKVASSDILLASEFKKNKDFLQQYFARADTIEKIKQKNPRIKSVKVTVSSVNTFKVSVTEYSEIAQLAKDKKFYAILQSGHVLEKAQDNPIAGLVTLENFTNQKMIMKTITALNQLPASIQSGISQVAFSPTNSDAELLNLFMNDGNKVIVSINNMKKQMPFYPQVVKELKEPGIVDMQVGIFYSPYPKAEPETSDSTEKGETQSSAETVTSDQRPADMHH